MRSNRVFRALLFAGFFAGALSACATSGENSALATSSEPHATLEKLLQADVSSTRYPARLAHIDGQAVSSSRRTYPLTPGTHTLSIELDIDAVRRYEPETGRYDPKPSRLSSDLREKQVTITFVAGEHYKFGAEIEDLDYFDWEPFVVKADELK